MHFVIYLSIKPHNCLVPIYHLIIVGHPPVRVSLLQVTNFQPLVIARVVTAELDQKGRPTNIHRHNLEVQVKVNT